MIEETPSYWRSLEELEGSAALEELVRREFPQGADLWTDEIGRRRFLKLMAASLGLWGWTGCTKQPEEKIVPYVIPPEEIVPGRPLSFASAMSLGGFGRGVLVESHQGRPIKIEGNPDHPASLGAADAMTQASVLGLWDPDRAQVVLQAGTIATWGALLEAWGAQAARLRESRGRGFRLLTETVTSPTLLSQIQALLALYPEARWHHWDPLAPDGARKGARLAFGKPVNTVFRLDRAERILSLDSDFLLEEPGSLRYAREFIDARRIRSPVDRQGRTVPGRLTMNRLYAVQSSPTLTGSMADHLFTVRPSEIEPLARALAGRLGVPGAPSGPGAARAPWIEPLVADLKQHAGASLVVAGRAQPPAVHALTHAMNAVLGNAGKTMIYTEPPDPHPADAGDSLAELARELHDGGVEALVILGANPVYTAPADLRFREALERNPARPLRIHQSLYYDETSFHCQWHIPETHYLESWSDVRAFDGTVSIVQPLIAPLYRGKSPHQLLAALLGQPDLELATAVHAYWRNRKGGPDFERFWEDVLRKGVVPDTALPPLAVTLDQGFLSKAPAPAPGPAEALELVFRPDPSIGDGRFANNGWLQELPKPLSKLTWDNAAVLSPATARSLGLEKEEVVKLRAGDREVEAPVWVEVGQPDGAVTVHLGYGRERAGRLGNRSDESGGFDAYRLRSSKAPWFEAGLEVLKTGRRRTLASTQHHQLLEGPVRDLLRVHDLGTFTARAREGRPAEKESADTEPAATLHRDYDYSQGHRWAMQIDINSCIGCNACVVACQAENNVPIVGKSQVQNAREMHWIRIDTFFESRPAAAPGTYFEPIPCMHCERAPCEPVCPVGATTHSVEGLNEMTYNRCVGTRYCSNNCPYKVRRFNFLQYADLETPSLQLGHNPDVTVRARGVMEKCTYCVQRINHARIDLKKLKLELSRAGSPEERTRLTRSMDERMAKLEPACAQTCPTRAIVFGDLNWKFTTEKGPEESLVKKLQDEPQDYALLAGLNTRPRTRYLPRFRNPNPELEAPGSGAASASPAPHGRH